MKKFVSILLGLISVVQSFAQQEVTPVNLDSSFVLMRTFEGDIADAALDNLQNLYIISSKGQVKKFNAGGDSAGVYNQVRNFGKLTTLDVSNPLKLLLFYKDFSTVVVLDRFLSSLATLDLRRAGILQPGAIGLSYDNNIWVFDEYDNKLKKVDEQGNRLMESNDLRNVFNAGLSPQKIMSNAGLVYLADTAAGVFVFDNYGSFKKRYPVQNWQSIAIVNNRIVSTQSESITVFNTATFLQAQKKYPFFQPYLHSFANADRFVSFSSNRLQVYQYRF